jgi:ATP-binding cassette subfamily F protein uup
VKSLSGGERNRLLLARLLSRPTNVLVLDEPTNDLDIETLELLEVLLQDYSGTLFLVSHDRAFLDNVVTQVIAFEGDGVFREYVGGYEDWVRVRSSVKLKEKQDVRLQKTVLKARTSKQSSRIKLSYNEMRELEALPTKIEILEQEQANITCKLSDAATYHDSSDQIVRLQTRFVGIEKEITSHLFRWDELETKRLAAEQNTLS